MFTQQDIETLLGHPVTSDELTTIQAYISAAQGEVEKILGFPIVVQTEGSEEVPADGETPAVPAVPATEATERTFKKRANRHTIFTPPFTDLELVKYNGDTLTDHDFDAMWFDDYDSTLKNSVVLEDHYGGCEKTVIKAKWGFKTLPIDLKTAWFQYAMDLEAKKRGDVSSESLGAYSIAYRASSSIVGQPYLAVIGNYAIKGL